MAERRKYFQFQVKKPDAAEEIVAPAERIGFKFFRLITPEKAEELGVHAESPVFVSPRVKGKHICGVCNHDYTPLVYQTHNETTSQHFHDSPHRSEAPRGGIYVSTHMNNIHNAWVGRGVLRGRIYDTGGIVQAESMRITSIIAQEAKSRKRLEEGRLVQVGNQLIPVRFEGYDPMSVIKPSYTGYEISDTRIIETDYTFRITDGVVYFSQKAEVQQPASWIDIPSPPSNRRKRRLNTD